MTTRASRVSVVAPPCGHGSLDRRPRWSIESVVHQKDYISGRRDDHVLAVDMDSASASVKLIVGRGFDKCAVS